MIGISLESWLTIIAIIIGPISAVQIQKIIEKKSLVKERKLNVYRDLMSTRATTLDHKHVSALNLVPLEFDQKSDKKIINAWNSYIDQLNSFPKEEAPNLIAMWAEKRSDLLADLLYEMSESLGFNYDKVNIKNNSYTPKGHQDIEDEQRLLRQGFIDFLEGKKPIAIKEHKD